jgi:hypothetical protein
MDLLPYKGGYPSGAKGRNEEKRGEAASTKFKDV